MAAEPGDEAALSGSLAADAFSAVACGEKKSHKEVVKDCEMHDFRFDNAAHLGCL